MICRCNVRSIDVCPEPQGSREMRPTVTVDAIKVDQALYNFVNDEAIPGSGIQAQDFWRGFAGLVRDLAPRNAALLAPRDELQAKIDAWHRADPGPGFDPAKYKAFLNEIGYLVAEKEPFAVSTANVDAEIAHIAGPQLVVPVSNARYALNAANARWGSLYDALYGTDVISQGEAPRGGHTIHNEVRRSLPSFAAFSTSISRSPKARIATH